jgi:PmbA protein
VTEAVARAQDILADLVAQARAAGADAADAVLHAGAALSVQRRLGRLEHLERAEDQDVGLRVFVGRRAAIVSAASLDPRQFAELAGRAVAMARVVPEDPYGGLAEQADAPADGTALDVVDPHEPDVATLLDRAAAAEDAALAVPGVTNTEGAEAGWRRTETVLVTSAGFAGRYMRTGHSFSVTALAGTGVDMQRDYDFASAPHAADLDDPAECGRRAGDRAIARLNPGRPTTARMPVVYDPRVAGSLLGHLAGAINGASVARGTTFLKDRLGERVFAPGIQIVDDPLRVRGLRSRVADAEGVATRTCPLVEDGVLLTWLLDTRSARQLGMRSLGQAGRGTGSPPSPTTTNLFLRPGAQSPADLMSDIALGLYVTELIGSGVNGVTGDYSRGAAGFMIRDGALAEPVAEITIAGRLPEMFLHMLPADDLRFRRGTDSPTVRVEGMTVGGA